jgi:hypothetical protein
MKTWPSRLVVAALVAAAVVVSVATPRTAEAVASVSCSATTTTESTPALALDSYRAVNPRRLIDTRDGTGGVRSPISPGCTLEFTIDTTVPADAQAVALSVTAVAPGRGFFTVFPCAAGRPATSNVNARAGIPTPNLVVAMMDSTRRICVYSNHRSDVVIDIAGWWGPGADRFTAIAPVRAYDSRIDGGGGRLPGGVARAVPIAPTFVPAGATAAVINFTATDAVSPGWLVVFPCGEQPPLASNLNVIASEDRAVAAIVGLGRTGAATGQLCVRSLMDTHFVVDVTGYYAPEGFGPTPSLRPLLGERLVDSRDGTGGWSTPLAAGETRILRPLVGRPEADEASAVTLNVVATNGLAPGNVRVFPCGGAVTSTSSVNFGVAAEATNLVNVKLGADGTVCVFSTQRVDLVIDLFGVMAAPEGALLTRLSFGSAVVFPEFGVDDPDYAIQCGPGTNVLNLQLGLAVGATATVRGVEVEAGALTVTVPAEAIVPIEVRRNADIDRYWFRCLPADFPRLRVERPGDPAPGWYLTSVNGGGASPSYFNVILDERGAPIWYKRSTEQLVNLQRLDDGSLVSSPLGLFLGTTDDALTHWIHELDGDLVTTHGTSDADAFPVDHHDYLPGPAAGGWTIVSYPFRGDVDTRSVPWGGQLEDNVLDSAIVELDRDGNAVWQWNTKDYFDLAETTFPQRFGRWTNEFGGEIDLIHVNSFQRLAGGDYVVSARHLDAVFRVDRATGDVAWILGSLPSSPADPPVADDPYLPNKSGAPRLEIVGDPWGGPRRQHDARLEAVGGTLLLTVYDNRTGMVGQTARVVVYEIDEVALTATMVREIRNPGGAISGALGSARLADDGSVLVNWGQLQPMFQEFDASNELQLSITQEPARSTYRIVKYPPSSFDRATLRVNAGGSLVEPP